MRLIFPPIRSCFPVFPSFHPPGSCPLDCACHCIPGATSSLQFHAHRGRQVDSHCFHSGPRSHFLATWTTSASRFYGVSSVWSRLSRLNHLVEATHLYRAHLSRTTHRHLTTSHHVLWKNTTCGGSGIIYVNGLMTNHTTLQLGDTLCRLIGLTGANEVKPARKALFISHEFAPYDGS